MTKAAGMKAIALFLAFGGVTAHAQTLHVDRAPERWKTLREKISWAENEANRVKPSGEYSIVYRITRLMERNVFYATGSTMRGSVRSSTDMYRQLGLSDSTNTFRRGIMHDDPETASFVLVKKDIAIILTPGEGSSSVMKAASVKFCTMDLACSFGTKQVYWLGTAEPGESVALLVRLFEQSATSTEKERIIQAVGVHQESPTAATFLLNVLRSEEQASVRGAAALWLPAHDVPDAVNILTAVVSNDPAQRVQEKALAALSGIDTDEALEALVAIVRNERKAGIRKKAVQYLGHRAAGEAARMLGTVLDDDPDGEVQRQAVFALANLPGGKGMDRLIMTARSHPNPRVRKAAIQALGNSDCDKAIQALVDIARQ